LRESPETRKRVGSWEGVLNKKDATTLSIKKKEFVEKNTEGDGKSTRRAQSLFSWKGSFLGQEKELFKSPWGKKKVTKKSRTQHGVPSRKIAAR